MNGEHAYDLLTDTNRCDAIHKWQSDAADCFVQRNQWEHEQIYRSLKDSNCDDVIKLLLADAQRPNADQIYCDIADERTYDIADDVPAPATAPKANTMDGTESASEWRALPRLPKSSYAGHIINLDKNRINLRRARAKLLPRPISLPSSLKLFRNFHGGNGAVASDKQFGKVDLEFIKRLEDNIYGNRDELHCSAESNTNSNCDSYDEPAERGYEPTQVAERRRFDEKLVKFNRSQHLVMLLDAWQLQPLLLRNDNSIDSKRSSHSMAEFASAATANGRPSDAADAHQSIVIVDNSHYYPVFMAYDIGTGKQCVQQPARHHHHHNGHDACECIKQSASEKDFSNLVQARVEQLAQQYQMARQWNADGLRPLSGVIVHDVARAEKAPKPTGAKSSFLRFMQRVRARTKAKPEPPQAPKGGRRPCEAPPQPPKPNDIRASVHEPNYNCNRLSADAVIKDHKSDRSPAEWHTIWRLKERLTERNVKLKWLLCTKPKIAAFKMRLLRRRHSMHGTSARAAPVVAAVHKAADMQSSLIVQPNDYDLVYCTRFPSIGWSCSDLLDVQEADRLRKFYVKQDKYHRRMRSRWQGDRFEAPHAKSVSDSDNSSLVSGEVAVRRHPTRRGASFRLKRHSIDSATAMTDVVKAWVYRKRFPYFSTSLHTKSPGPKLSISYVPLHK